MGPASLRILEFLIDCNWSFVLTRNYPAIEQSDGFATEVD